MSYIQWVIGPNNASCNFRCKFCCVKMTSGFPCMAESNLVEAEKSVRALIDEHKATTLVLTSRGEPMLQKDFPEVLRRAESIVADTGIRCVIHTNGSVYKEIPKTITPIMSVPYSTQYSYGFLVGHKRKLSKTMRAFTRLNPHTRINLIVVGDLFFIGKPSFDVPIESIRPVAVPKNAPDNEVSQFCKAVQYESNSSVYWLKLYHGEELHFTECYTDDKEDPYIVTQDGNVYRKWENNDERQ